VVADQFAAVFVADLSRLVDDVRATGTLGHVFGYQADQPAAKRTQPLTVFFGDAGVPGSLRAALAEAAADAGERELTEGAVRLSSASSASSYEAVQVFLREAAVAAGSAERANVTGIGPAPESGLVYA
jgi:hypothetical protein